MKHSMAAVCTSLLLVAGCERLEQVADAVYGNQDEAKRSQEQRSAIRESQDATSIQGDRDLLAAVIGGKLTVLSNSVSEIETAIRELHEDRRALSRELGSITDGSGNASGANLELALASRTVNEIAMKYLHMDFSVARVEFREALTKARKDEMEFKRELMKLDRTFESLLDADPQKLPAERRAGNLASLQRERLDLEHKRDQLKRMTVPTANAYRNKREEQNREVYAIDNRLRKINLMIDQLMTSDERMRSEAKQTAIRNRERALDERNRAVTRLKQENLKKTDVLKTIQIYTEKTLSRLEQALTKEAAALDGKLRKSREAYLTLQGFRASVPTLSGAGLRQLQKYVLAL